MQAVLINGSPRKHGNTSFVGSIISKLLTAGGWKVEEIDLYDLDFSGCIGCERCREDNRCTGIEDDFTLCYHTLEASELWILGSPVHNYNVTSWMKACIDMLASYRFPGYFEKGSLSEDNHKLEQFSAHFRKLMHSL